MNYYDSIAPGYDELHKAEQQYKIRFIKDELNLTGNELMLDLGCGPYYGHFECKVVGVDPSYELLKKTSIPCVLGLAEFLPFKDDTFDIVVSITAFQNFTDHESAIEEMKRVCKGRFIVSYLSRSPKSSEIMRLLNYHFFVVNTVTQDKDDIIIAKYK